jgi:hypothetical protein
MIVEFFQAPGVEVEMSHRESVVSAAWRFWSHSRKLFSSVSA